MNSRLATIIRNRGREVENGTGVTTRVLSFQTTRKIAEETRTPPRDIEIEALHLGIIPTRYLRNIPTLGAEGQARLLSSSAAVVGAGGLGGLVIELLARLGMGRITVIDGDSFSEDNLNRQLLAREKDLGRLKARRAEERVAEINSAVEVSVRPVFLDPENAEELLGGSDLIIDALDRIDVRILLEDTARRSGIPLVHGAIGGFLGEIATIIPGEDTLHSLYRQTAEENQGLESELGTPTPTPAAVAALQVVEAIKILLGKGRPFSEEILYLELMDGFFSRIRLNPEKEK